MTQIPENIIKWLDYKAKANEPRRLRKDAPEEVKKEFEEFMRKRKEERAKGILK